MNKTRFQVHLEPTQLAAMARITQETGAPVSAQVRFAIDAWLAGRRPVMTATPRPRPRATTKGTRR